MYLCGSVVYKDAEVLSLNCFACISHLSLSSPYLGSGRCAVRRSWLWVCADIVAPRRWPPLPLPPLPSPWLNCLSRFIDWYETLSYEPLVGRRKRSSLDGSYTPLHLRFTSHNRSFHLILRSLDENSDVFSDSFVFDVDGRHEHVPVKDFVVHGHDKNDPHSTLYGSFRDGIFEGHIIYGDGESYTVDRVDRYLHWNRRPKHFHSIIYSGS
ncbi:unnamed protein product [Gongylonema pulchrum]|uniref:Pep_M12B_propep domain-containing protein n=1 Tax=Gongylonema pulchrum TaxID=637853 RepID=A0A183E1K7_9BILA|nr:unnamed protein product [Gongylonema pulchrum]